MKSIQKIGNSVAMPLVKNVIVALVTLVIFASCHNKNWGYCQPPESIRVTPPSKEQHNLVLTGIVKDREGVPLENVDIVLANQVVAVTDAAGKFAVNKSNVYINDRLTFSCVKENYNNASFSYHSQMDNKNFEVAMGKPCICKPDDKTCDCIEDINFDYMHSITDEIELSLDRVVDCMKNKPECAIEIIYHFAEDKRTARQRATTIKEYLTEKGINENRIKVSTNYTTNEKSHINIIKTN